MARQAPKEPPKPFDDDPSVVDLARYKRARQAQAKAKAKGSPTHGEPLLGSRPRAGLILAAMVLLMLALWVVSSLH